MNIIFGTGINGQNIYNKYFKGTDVVFYDNNRKKWGEILCGIPIINLDELMNLLKEKTSTIIVATKQVSGLYFLKDVCTSSNRIKKLENEEFIPVNLAKLEPFKIDVEALELRKIAEYEKIKKYYKEIGNEAAYKHAVGYIDYKKNNLAVPEIGGIELTNYCNLACANCPSSTCKRAKGYMSDEVFERVFPLIPPNKKDYFSLHGLGEPLLHPQFINYLKRLVEINVSVLISTNGVLLDDKKINEIFEILRKTENSMMYISFHTKKSVENWKRCVEWIEENQTNTNLYGQILEHNTEDAHMWLYEVGEDKPKENKYIRYITSHSFAGNVKGRRKNYSKVEVMNRYRNCYSINSNISAVAWDGRLKSCCLDSELDGDVGSVFDISNARLSMDGYVLCNHCDPDWTSNFQ
ncbi:MAG: radical SAM protein [Lachnospiraceae bacterium]|nr:radical SAM protein [Lachnospiraceae bacterium]